MVRVSHWRGDYWFSIGFCAAVPFWAVDMAGFLLDTLRGATMGTIFNSTIEAETSLFGLLFSQFLCVIFLYKRRHGVYIKHSV